MDNINKPALFGIISLTIESFLQINLTKFFE